MTRRALVLLLGWALLPGCGGDDDAETAPTSTLAPLTEPRDEAIVAGNGAVIAFDPSTGEDVRTIAAVGDFETRTGVPFDVDVDWIRETVYFTASTDCLYDIRSVPLAGGEPESVAEFAGFARVSPDGGNLAWIQDDAEDDDSCFSAHELVVRDLESGDEQRRTVDDAIEAIEWFDADTLAVTTQTRTDTLDLAEFETAPQSTSGITGVVIGATTRGGSSFLAIRQRCDDDLDLTCPSEIQIVDDADRVVRTFGPFADSQILDVAFPAAGDVATADLLLTVREGGSDAVCRLEGSELVAARDQGGSIAW